MKISLVMISQNPASRKQYIPQTLSIAPLFYEVIVHSNTPSENKWIPSYPNLKIINDEQPITCYEALNKVIKETKGEWVLPICDDDKCDYKELAHVMAQTMISSAEIVFAPFYYGNERMGWKITQTPVGPITFDSIRTKNLIPFTTFFKKSIWEAIGGFQNLPFNDWVFWMEAAKQGAKFQVLHTPYFYWRHCHLGTKSLCDKEGMESKEISRKKIFDYLASKYENIN